MVFGCCRAMQHRGWSININCTATIVLADDSLFDPIAFYDEKLGPSPKGNSTSYVILHTFKRRLIGQVRFAWRVEPVGYNHHEKRFFTLTGVLYTRCQVLPATWLLKS